MNNSALSILAFGLAGSEQLDHILLPGGVYDLLVAMLVLGVLGARRRSVRAR